jgi:hypothetical protein
MQDKYMIETDKRGSFVIIMSSRFHVTGHQVTGFFHKAGYLSGRTQSELIIEVVHGHFNELLEKA